MLRQQGSQIRVDSEKQLLSAAEYKMLIPLNQIRQTLADRNGESLQSSNHKNPSVLSEFGLKIKGETLRFISTAFTDSCRIYFCHSLNNITQHELSP